MKHISNHKIILQINIYFLVWYLILSLVSNIEIWILLKDIKVYHTANFKHS